ncbi:unnamed protein product, partial [Heligmosomoides polygyrus]|uniref:Reverse transcriptase domain-containing protein n=1 Tax=Heligmosomoides polygyrus TaxID=6339 RepID=A0A183FWI6_HELPZ
NEAPTRAPTGPASAIIPDQECDTRVTLSSNAPLRHTFNNICVRQYRNSKHIHALSLIDPTWTARSLLDRDDISAALENGTLAVTRCKPVNTTNVFTNHNVNNTCYSLLLLEIGDHIWFSVPDTKDLQEYEKLESRLRRRGVLESTIAGIQSIGSTVSKSFQSVYDTTTQKLSSGVESIRWSIIYLVMYITIPTLIIIVLEVFCIYCTKLCLLRRASTTAASAFVELAYTLAPRTTKNKINAVIIDVNVPREPTRFFVPRAYAIRSFLADSPTTLPYITIFVNNLPIIVLFDSGSSISYMRQSSVKAQKCAEKTFPTKIAPAQTANGSEIAMIGTVELPVRIASSSLTHSFYVSADDQCFFLVLTSSAI